MVAVFASERKGGTNEIAVSDTAVRTNRSAGRALEAPRLRDRAARDPGLVRDAAIVGQQAQAFAAAALPLCRTV
ncbi:hypothetical protein GCM10027062_24730 [Nocardioides hungaricus]